MDLPAAGPLERNIEEEAVEREEDLHELLERASSPRMSPLNDGRIFDGISILVKATLKLDETNKVLSKNSETLARRNLSLTWVIALLTFVIAGLTIAQIVIAWKH